MFCVNSINFIRVDLSFVNQTVSFLFSYYYGYQFLPEKEIKIIGLYRNWLLIVTECVYVYEVIIAI